jgi:uncharacterized membrane protein
MTNLFNLLILLAALGSGLLSGLFFTFSNFVMKALAKLPANQGSSAMQSINVTIINPGFLTVFFGTALCSVAAAVLGIQNWDRPGAGWALGGAVLYLVGCMVVTFCCNVPLNNELAAVAPESPAMSAKWKAYLASWMPWNHLRTIATFLATASFVIALFKLGAAS